MRPRQSVRLERGYRFAPVREPRLESASAPCPELRLRRSELPTGTVRAAARWRAARSSTAGEPNGNKNPTNARIPSTTSTRASDPARGVDDPEQARLLLPAQAAIQTVATTHLGPHDGSRRSHRARGTPWRSGHAQPARDGLVSCGANSCQTSHATSGSATLATMAVPARSIDWSASRGGHTSATSVRRAGRP
jgi:hypothetical protein